MLKSIENKDKTLGTKTKPTDVWLRMNQGGKKKKNKPSSKKGNVLLCQIPGKVKSNPSTWRGEFQSSLGNAARPCLKIKPRHPWRIPGKKQTHL